MMISPQIRRYHFLAVVPPAHLSAEARSFQQDFARRYGAKAALRNPPHFTLVPPFELTCGESAHLADALERSLSRTPPLDVAITGFGAFAQRVIFMEADCSPRMAELASELRNQVENLFPGRLKPESRPFHPHLTLAYRDLTPAAFHDAWCEFREKKLEAEFTARGVVLYRHENDAWRVLRDIPFADTQPTAP